MEFQQGQNYMHCILLCCGDNLYNLSCHVLYILLCHLSWCDCRWHAVGKSVHIVTYSLSLCYYSTVRIIIVQIYTHYVVTAHFGKVWIVME